LCSIIGYSGPRKAAPLLVGALRKMEYRGYDSVGIATLNEGRLLIRKGLGKVEEVNNSLALQEMEGMSGIGHTRWATHGGIIDYNAHPHSACTGKIAIVHNGIIENHEELKDGLLKLGHKFKSNTDSEVIAHLLEQYWSYNMDVKDAMINTCNRLKGSFAFVAIFDDSTLCAARYDEPLIVGVTDSGYFISSDVLGFLTYTQKAIFLDNRDMVILEGNHLSIINFDGKEVERTPSQVAWELADSNKGGYAFFTNKEIHEQTHTILKSLNQKRESVIEFCNQIQQAGEVYITGSGTSYHSALLGRTILAKYADIRSEAIMSSEFQYSTAQLNKRSVLLAISQSGETADLLQSVKLAKEKGAKIISIVNVPTSSLARLSDCFLEVKCGPEIGVAATKSFTSQLAILYYVADTLSGNMIGISEDKAELTQSVQKTLQLDSLVAQMAEKIKDCKDIYILGRSNHFPICLEGALKIKELAYIHAEGLAAGELKHGPLALIDKNSVVIILNPDDCTYIDTVSNANVVKARGARIIGITNYYNPLYDYNILIPMIRESLLPLLEVIPLQMLAYHLALFNNANPDYPRNLAKSVTVR
jgi:glucosamine--fructose-6-phosphate aminotransferase (isomerizing)